ncbi:hypothetical protein TcasGA2_TC014164 [Tribolium castaneum]|uniref:Uncharacterized protein n=1 Tax=Tribolium castaneum TaxID=7070 RepID=D6WKK6_TRICA|nr:hypothetical protein TcasGA2_TC014164 [Tribolium castaneum]
MIEEAPVRRLNRRTRGERNKRRERYFYSNDSYNYETESDVLTDDALPPFTPPPSPSNNNIKSNKKSKNNVDNLKTVRNRKSDVDEFLIFE